MLCVDVFKLKFHDNATDSQQFDANRLTISSKISRRFDVSVWRSILLTYEQLVCIIVFQPEESLGTSNQSESALPVIVRKSA